MDAMRWLRHWFHAPASRGFPPAVMQAIQDAMLAKVRAAGMRMVGPNCLGLLNADPAVALDATFAPTWPPHGNVAFSSQSGAVGLAILDYAKELGIGIHQFVSIGNKADVSGNDLIEYWGADPQVQVYVSDGLSSTAVEANVRDLLPALEQGLKLHGLSVGTPFFVKYGRVRSMEPISQTLGATVTCVLLGERPGLATPESLSAYLAYRARVGMPESERNCVSNIHREGTGPVEAGAHIADLIAKMIEQQVSGINLKV